MEVSQHVRAILSFVEAADLNNFSDAARKLGISPAAVSKNIAGLEQVLGVRLMNRTTRKINLTEDGEAFLVQARIALQALENAVDGIVARKMEMSGHVKISTSTSFGKDHLLPALPELMARYPHLSIEADFDDRVIDLVRDGYDIAIRGGRIVDSSLITRPVCRLHTVLVAAPAYLAQYGVPKSPDDLKQHRLIARRFLGGRLSQWGFKSKDNSLSIFDPADAVLKLSAPEALVQATVAGLGIAQVGISLVHQLLAEGKLNTVLWGQYDTGDYEMVIQYPHRSFIAPRIKMTVDYLLAYFEQDAALHVPSEQLAMYEYR